MWALIRKETLENVRWLPLAWLVTCSLAVASFYQGWIESINPVTGNFLIASSLLAIGFGLLQSIPDERNGARAYLLHRGVTASEVFWAKTLVGFGLVFLAIALPLVCAAVWLGWRGVLNAPGRPMQIWAPAALSFTGFLFYPTTLLIIYRPARWLGSRVLPVVVPLTVAVIAVQAAMSGDGGLSDYAVVVAISLAVLLVLLAAAHRAYTELANQPPPSSRAFGSGAVIVVMLFGTWIATMAVFAVVVTIEKSFRPPTDGFYQVLANETDQQLWIVRARQRWVKAKSQFEWEYLSGAPLLADVSPDPAGTIPADFSPVNNGSLYKLTDFQGDPVYMRILGAAVNGPWTTLADRRGYLLCYSQIPTENIRLGQVISRDGIHDPKGDWGKPFDGLFSVDPYNRLGLVGDNNGIYQIDEASGVRAIVERHIDSMRLSDADDKPLRLYVREGAKIAIYDIADESGAIDISNETRQVRALGKVQATLVDEFEMPDRVAQLPTITIYYRGVNDWTIHGYGGAGSYHLGSVAQRLPSQAQATTFTVIAPPELYRFTIRDALLGALSASPLPALGEPLYKYFTVGEQQDKSFAEVVGVPLAWLPLVIVLFLVQSLLAGVLTWRAAHYRGLSRRATGLWIALALAIGWSIPLAVLACYPRLIREACSHCHKSRRVDLVRCEHCQAEWERTQREGIEIIEDEFDQVMAAEVS